ncbi:MAG: hypothetical protein JNJ85_08220, partial [Candidatus Kapabacteria bacterium]|nr:hypothetical protein [Candidatus Kapabacteria bacterium]
MDSVKQEEELLRVSLEEVEFPKVREIVARHCMTVLGKEHLLDIVPLN